MSAPVPDEGASIKAGRVIISAGSIKVDMSGIEDMDAESASRLRMLQSTFEVAAAADEKDAEIERLRSAIKSYEDSISWDVTCLNCSKLMDQIYELEQVRLPAAHAAGVAEGVAKYDALKAAVEGALDGAKVGLSLQPADCNNSCADGPCTCSGVSRPCAWTLDPDIVRAALAAVEGDAS